MEEQNPDYTRPDYTRNVGFVHFSDTVEYVNKMLTAKPMLTKLFGYVYKITNLEECPGGANLELHATTHPGVEFLPATEAMVEHLAWAVTNDYEFVPA